MKKNPILQLFIKTQGINIDVSILRCTMGVLGLALPVVLVVWGFFIFHGFHFLGSLSAYYGERTRDVFVGILCSIGFILFAYTGKSILDIILGKCACVCAVLVAIFPSIYSNWQSKVHLICACLLFVILALFSLVLFTKSRGSPQDVKGTAMSILRIGQPIRVIKVFKKKKIRNGIYIACGTLMLISLLLLLLYYVFWQNTSLSDYPFVLIFEWIMIWAFGFSWLIKAEAIPIWSDPR